MSLYKYNITVKIDDEDDKYNEMTIRLVIKPKIPYPNHPNPFSINIDKAIKIHNRIAESANIQIYNRIKNLTNKFFKDNNIPLKVGDRIIVVNGKVGTIVSLHDEPCKYFRYYKYIPMIKIELDENKDLKYFASLTNIKKI